VAGEEAHIVTATILDLLTLIGDRSLGELMLGLREGMAIRAASTLEKAKDGYSSSNVCDTLEILIIRLTYLGYDL
jgi:hypothetical protein